MVDAVRSCAVTCACLLVGAREDDWVRSERCTEPFRLAPLTDYPSVRLFAENKKAWLNLLRGGSARPTSIPTRVSTYPVANFEVAIDGVAGSLRCVRVHPSGNAEISFDPRWGCGTGRPALKRLPSTSTGSGPTGVSYEHSSCMGVRHPR